MSTLEQIRQRKEQPNYKLTDLDIWEGVNKLIGEEMPLVEHSLIGDMETKDVTALDRLRGIVTVYRGMSVREATELQAQGQIVKQSWTLSPKVARFFAEKHGSSSRGKRVVRVKILKSDILGYTNSRKENEVIIRRGALIA